MKGLKTHIAWAGFIGMLILVLSLGVATYLLFRGRYQKETFQPLMERKLQQVATIPSAQAKACAACHEEEFRAWFQSQHAWANRLIGKEEDHRAFTPSRDLSHGSFVTQVHRGKKPFALTQTGPDGKSSRHRPEAVIGVEPLIQYLVPFPGGKLQVWDMAYDPQKDEWFPVFGDQDRQPHEWGFWKNRGNNWNAQCAFCHMTEFRKNYHPETDSYQSTWEAMGVSCRQCHGPMEEHLANPTAKIPRRPWTDKPMMDNCASCHSRREELNGEFKPGENYHDHFRLTLADNNAIYYPDGQVLEENFSYGSFMMSRMGHRGITCLDCHNPHSGQLTIPVHNNQLCLSCHQEPGRKEATIIDPLTHSHHPRGSRGDACIECHMPTTTYMQRDPRRDHGFTSPDPQLTEEFGIPNACNRCHSEKTVAWSVTWVERWYGDKMRQRRARTRTRVVARAQKHDSTVVAELVALARSEEIAYWKATLLALMSPWGDHNEVQKVLVESLKHEHPLVRTAAVRSLAPLSGSHSLLEPLLQDPVRIVRLDVAWALLQQGKADNLDDEELLRHLHFISDEPAGAVRRGQFALAKGQLDEAEKWLRKAVAWDYSAYPRHILGRILHLNGNPTEAVTALQKAAEIEPENPEHPYTLALLYAEIGQPSEALRFLEKTVEIEPTFGRAWYNLGLAYAQAEVFGKAIFALRKAEQWMPQSPEPSYARATVHLRQGDIEQTRRAAQKALEIAPDHRAARALLKEIP